MYQSAAPEAILELVHCHCKKRKCISTCSCKKNGLVCTDLCKCMECENENPEYLDMGADIMDMQ